VRSEIPTRCAIQFWEVLATPFLVSRKRTNQTSNSLRERAPEVKSMKLLRTWNRPVDDDYLDVASDEMSQTFSVLS